MQIAIVASECLAHGLPPITFENYDLAAYFLKTLNHEIPIDMFTSLVKVVTADVDMANAARAYLYACIGQPT